MGKNRYLSRDWGQLKSDIKNYTKVAEAGGLYRRYFVMNSFDGALSILGVIVAAYSTGNANAHIIINAGIGLAIATGISGFVGAYLSERAERVKKIKDIENSIMMDINGSLLYRASKFAMVMLAIVDGLSPAISIFITLLPFFAHQVFPDAFMLDYAMMAAVLINLALLGMLGAFLGKISQTSVVKYGLMTLLIGVGIVVLLYFTGY